MILATKAAVATAAEGWPYLWVMGGNNGALYTSDSTTADSWTSRTSGFGSGDIMSIATDGATQYIAVGELGKLATSPDGITWTLRTSGFSLSSIRCVTYGNGYWVIVGPGKLSYSTDGITWTANNQTGNTLTTVSYGNGYFATTDGSTVWYTTDPTGSWSTSTDPDIPVYTWSGSLYYWPEQSIWIMGFDAGTTSALATSTDLSAWTSRTAPFTISISRPGAFASNSSVAILCNTTATTPTCDVGSSTNGTTWTNRTPADSTESMVMAASDDNGFIIAVGTKVQSTSDGTSWTDRGAAPVTQTSADYSIGLCHSSGLPSIR